MTNTFNFDDAPLAIAIICQALSNQGGGSMSHVPAEPILTSRRPATPDPERGWVTCAFCGGTGIDPFGIMSELSTCSRCMGHGIVYVRPPHLRCAYCRGTGRHKTYACPVCKGAGVVTRPPGTLLTCPDCRGRGYEAESGMPCRTCKGIGVVTSGRNGRFRKAVHLVPATGSETR